MRRKWKIGCIIFKQTVFIILQHFVFRGDLSAEQAYRFECGQSNNSPWGDSARILIWSVGSNDVIPFIKRTFREFLKWRHYWMFRTQVLRTRTSWIFVLLTLLLPSTKKKNITFKDKTSLFYLYLCMSHSGLWLFHV